MEGITISAEAILDALKSDIGKIQKSWTQSLLVNLGDPVVQGRFGLLTPKQRKMIEDFIEAKELPDEISNDFLQSLKEVLSDLAKVPLRLGDLKAALFPDGNPTTRPSSRIVLKTLFPRFSEVKMRGKQGLFWNKARATSFATCPVDKYDQQSGTCVLWKPSQDDDIWDGTN